MKNTENEKRIDLIADAETDRAPKLELRNVTKIYTPKNGVSVTALDKVNIKLPDKGMIFILGKSGSGKSTMLNLLGGLDTPDSGELLIDGKSAGEFSAEDLDSYRNTSVGFVFQEYNVLEEFTIAANIALAIQLQGKKATDEELNRILEEVDLVGYADRKPNELSGGQLQRVAIARALIKNPDIIMADEPTGALDSKTGQQVFDTLKRLSRDKTVIVVSHDREFAELFGDRVIELADGRIIDDVTKEASVAAEAEGVSIIDDDVIRIHRGHKLSEEEWSLVRKYIESSEADSYISMSDNLNDKFRRVANINESGKMERFKKTEDSDVLKDCKPDKVRSELIKSRLPFKAAFKLGVNGLKYKKIRLAITIITTIISLCMFGLADSMASFDVSKALYNSLRINDIPIATIGKLFKMDYPGGYSYTTPVEMGADDVQRLEKAAGTSFIPVVGRSLTTTMNLKGGNVSSFSYFTTAINGVAELSLEQANEFDFTFTGTFPAKAGQIAIPHYLYESYAEFGYTYGNKTLEPEDITSPAVFLAQNPIVLLNNIEYRITAIVDTGFDSSRYDALKGAGDTYDNSIAALSYELQEMMLKSHHSTAYVAVGELSIYTKTDDFINLDYGNSRLENSQNSFSVRMLGNISDLDSESALLPEGKTLAADDILVDLTSASYMLDNYEDTEQRRSQRLTELIRSYISAGMDVPEAQTKATAESYKEIYVPEIAGREFTLFFANCPGGYCMQEKTKSVKVAGLLYNENAYYGDGRIAISNAMWEDMEIGSPGVYDFAFGKMPSGNQLKALTKMVGEKEFSMYDPIALRVVELNGIFELMGEIFLYCALACILLSALFLMNFIASSVAMKRKEIGILRAVGARSRDVFSIFFSESMVIAIINFLFGILCAGLTVFAVNTVLNNQFGMKLSLLAFGVRQIGIMLAAAVLSGFAGSFLPVYHSARKKPIDAIRKR